MQECAKAVKADGFGEVKGASKFKAVGGRGRSKPCATSCTPSGILPYTAQPVGGALRASEQAASENTQAYARHSDAGVPSRLIQFSSHRRSRD